MFGSEGIITRAQDAGRKTAEAKQNEQAFLDYAEDLLDNLGGNPVLAGKIADAGLPPETISSLVDVVDGVPIPKKFTVSTIPTEQTKAGGLVIIDNKGNEFVWVPVEDLTADGTRDGVTAVKFGRRTFGRSDSLGGTTQVADKYTEDLQEESDLVISVAKYGGFYIARYEASYVDGKVASKPSTTATYDTWVATNGRLWNYVSQTAAATACENMYSSDAKVVGHLPYGAEWDSTLQWFKQTVFSNSNTAIGSYSSGWGNYQEIEFTYGPSSTSKSSGAPTLINTGEVTDPPYRHRVNNIYDIAGNLMEWTQERYGTDTVRALRGGTCFYNDEGNSEPAAVRSKTYSNDVVGFRPAIYIK